jgi:hypothetical protein
MRPRAALVTVCLAMAAPIQGQQDGFRSLFDGQSLLGWEGDETVFRVVDGAIVGGTLEAPIPEGQHLCTTEQFGDFELRVSGRIEGEQNSGVGFRSRRLTGSTEVAGYQADMGWLPAWAMPIVSDVEEVEGDRYPLWGSLLDEYRPDPGRYPDPDNPYRLIAVADRDVIEDVLRDDDWNDVVVRAQGPRIEIWLNGVRTVDHVERDDVPRRGFICLQLHSGNASRAWYRDISIRELDGSGR